jgi:hypothetical protein
LILEDAVARIVPISNLLDSGAGMLRLLLFSLAVVCFFSCAFAVPGLGQSQKSNRAEQIVPPSDPRRSKFGSVRAEFSDANGKEFTRTGSAVKIGPDLVGTAAHGLFPIDGTIKNLARRVYYVPYGSRKKYVITEGYIHHFAKTLTWPRDLDIHDQKVDYAILRLPADARRMSSTHAEDWFDVDVKDDKEGMKFDALVISIPRMATHRYKDLLISQSCFAWLDRDRFKTGCTGSAGQSGAPVLEVDSLGKPWIRGFLSGADPKGTANASRLPEGVVKAIKKIRNGEDGFLEILPLVRITFPDGG